MYKRARLVILFQTASKNGTVACFSIEAHLLVRLKTSNIITNSQHITPLKLYGMGIVWGWGLEWNGNVNGIGNGGNEIGTRGNGNGGNGNEVSGNGNGGNGNGNRGNRNVNRRHGNGN